jgi:hypothetical protein
MIHRLQLAYIATLIVLGSAPLYGAAPGSVSGVVRDSAGLPQIGAEVQLLRADLSIICSTYTDLSGHYKIAPVLPGRYAVKALGAWFLPSLHENVRVRSNAVVNLTLSTLYEAMQWLPAEPRAGNAPKDDWKWTLRSAANRPLLRWLEDGPLVVVSDGDGAHPRLKARLMASGQKGVFGESGERISAAVEETPADSRELLASVDFSPGTDGSMESMLGFRQELGFAGSVQSVAAVALHPELEAGGGEGLDEAAVRYRKKTRLRGRGRLQPGAGTVLRKIRRRFDGSSAFCLGELEARQCRRPLPDDHATAWPGGGRGYRGTGLAAQALGAQWRRGHRARAASGTWLGTAH